VIAALAHRQYGVASRGQLLSAGVTRRQIDHRLRIGRLHALHRGVYAVGHAAPRAEARWLAAVLACGEGALLSHRSAASLWRIRMGEGPRPDVLLHSSRSHRRRGITVHRAEIVAADRDRHMGIPVTSPARTLVDLAHVLDERDLTRALREAQFLRRFDLKATLRALERRPSAPLRRLLADLSATESHIEDELLRICDRFGLPRPLIQQRVAGRRVDFLWPREKLVVEMDGWQAHGTRKAFIADRRATNALQLAGYTALRFTPPDAAAPERLAREIQAALRRRTVL